MSLRSGTSLITLTLLINKVSGLYGLLALLTGFQLNLLQLSMYLYSLAALVITGFLAPHIKHGAQSPFECLSLAWLYILDSTINAAYTAAFGVSWFLVLAQHNSPATDHSNIPGGQTIGDTAGFTNPTYNVSQVEVLDDGLVGHEKRAISATSNGFLSDTILQSGSIASITVISSLWMVRIYFILVVMAYARAVLRQYIVNYSQSSTDYSASEDKNYASDPFAETKPLGAGWKGKLGRIMVAIGRSYWLGADEADSTGLAEEEWAKGMDGRIKRGRAGNIPGVIERERRRRSGTGPPMLRSIELGEVRKSGERHTAS